MKLLVALCLALSFQCETCAQVTPQKCLTYRSAERAQHAEDIKKWVEVEMLRLYDGKPIDLTIKNSYDAFYSRTSDIEDSNRSTFQPTEDDYFRASQLLAADGWKAEMVDDAELLCTADERFAAEQARWNSYSKKWRKNLQPPMKGRLVHNSLYRVGAK